MKAIIISSIGIICLMAACVEEPLVNNDITPTPGKEVVFTADLSSPLTRTIYGDEVDTNGDNINDQIKVKWVDGDLISIYGTTCAVKQSEYEVEPAVNTTGDAYAASLTKTGAAGVQWGNAKTSDFIAVYPSTAKNITLNDNGSVTIPTSIDATQYNLFTKTTVDGVTVWQGTPFDNGKNVSTMPNAVMYAYTDEAQSGSTVDLRFKPFSTVLKFKVNTWTASQENPDLATNPTGKSIQVTNITLTAPESVAGDFNMTVSSNGVEGVAVSGSNSSTITVEPQAPITWLYGQALEFCIFVIPRSDLSLSSDWKVVISTSDGDKTFSLTPKTDANSVLAAGKIHKVNVKNGFSVKDVWTYDPATWMTSIPRNVYIADLSLPGAWYATDTRSDKGYQTGTLAEQYAAGIRAFNIDCRLTLSVNKRVQDYDGNITSGNYLTYIDNEEHLFDSNGNFTSDILTLACAGTESQSVGWVSSIGKTVKAALLELGPLAQSNDKEYVEVVLTVAQRAASENTGLTYTPGTVNAKMMYTAICNVLNDPEVKPYLYDFSSKDDNGNPKTLPEITLKDVLGKVVVKVNMNTENSNLAKTDWSIAAPAMFSEGSMAESTDADRFIKQANFTSMNSPAMYWSNSFTPAVGNEMVFHYHQAQNTTGSGGFPTIDIRKAAIESILYQSYTEYSSNGHNGWYQIGIGGWTDDNTAGKQEVALQLNKYVYNIVNSMLTGTVFSETGKTYQPAPVGAVLMNFVNDGTAPETGSEETDDTDPRYNRRLIKAIIDLNGAYFLNRDTTKEPWPDPDTKALPASNGAYAYVGEDAF